MRLFFRFIGCAVVLLGMFLWGCSGETVTADQPDSVEASAMPTLPQLRVHVEGRVITNSLKIKGWATLEEDGEAKWMQACKIKARGQVQAVVGIADYPKQMYALDLKDEQQISFFKPAKRWVLDASYIDKTFSRNQLAYDCYRLMDPNNISPSTMYVELWIDDEYEGIYILRERLNQERLEIGRGGVIVKQPSIFMALDDSIYHHHPEKYIYEQVHPKIEKENFLPEIARIQALIHQGSDEAFMHPDTGIAKWFDLENLIDWELSLLVANNGTGVFKNYYCIKRDSASPYIMALWDSDRGFGRDDDYELNLTGFLNVRRNVMLKRLHELNAYGYNDRMKERWAQHKSNEIGTASYFTTAVNSIRLKLEGAAARNAERWPYDGEFYTDANDFATEIQLIENWVQKREARVDSFVESL